MNSIQKFLYKHNKNLYQCIDDLSLTYLYKHENITFLLPTDKSVINSIIYNYTNDIEKSIKQIKSLFIKGYYPKMEHFNKVSIINFNNEKLNFNVKKSDDNCIVLEDCYLITHNEDYSKKLGFMLYNLETDKLPLNGSYVEQEKTNNISVNSNVNLNNIKNKLNLYIKNNYYNFLKKDINIFRVFSNLILTGISKNTISENKIINDESQKILNIVNTKITPISRSTFYLLIDDSDTFNIFKHINNDIFELIENIITNKSNNSKVIIKCNSVPTYNNLLKHIKQVSTNFYNKPSSDVINKLNSLANNPTNIDFINYLKKTYKETYSNSYSTILNNHIFTILCEIYICMEQSEINQSGIKSGYTEFKNNFLVFVETSKLNDLFKYSNDVVRMYSVFNTLTKCNFFLQNINTFPEESDKSNRSYTAYNRNPTNNETIYICENDADDETNENYEKLLEI
jgi:hypothetical protein